MSGETLVKRIVEVAECVCGYREVRDHTALRETKCVRCGRWVKFKEKYWSVFDKIGGEP